MVLAKDVNTAGRLLVELVKPFLPQFNLFHIKNAVVHDYILHPAYIPYTAIYGVLYIILVMLVAQILFRKKEL